MTKKRQEKLVLSHLENISGDVFEQYPTVIQNLIRGRSGVYALYRNHSLYYVGLASNLMRRLKAHMRDRHQGKWNRFSVYLTLHDDHMKELESLMLRIFKPRGNKVSGKFMASQNLKSELNKGISDQDADRRASLLGGRYKKRRVRVKTAGSRQAGAIAGLTDRAIRLRGWYLDWEYYATLRKDGRVSFDGQIYDSPSAAGKAARGRPTRGWSFWHYRQDGEWVPIRTLKK